MSTPEATVPVSTPSLGGKPTQRLPGALCESGCGRPATKASGYRWAWHCDPAVSAQAKKQALQLGGRRGQMTPSEAAHLFDQLEPASAESRTSFRLKLMELLSVGRLTGSMYRDLLAGLDGMGKDQERSPKGKPAPPLLVEVQRFGANGAEPTEPGS